ncbi:plasmid segregation centromere-binding protein ParR [Cronbergia sp. UHCC 0137]|uniref:plasmid segregation centromere-binding protein ParR n=1 Tax=Cronbergia sp. UHCC 0137 TaxID=3110239 RepID=UPI002B1E908F|nr:plasmid segregation centromere-binding protein ParR [Cronbergia sp. UHCC 0137]MEA5618115.1 plasmid segregation centromere-binding protein ParR [Cronbergia sp. UHCC 0137]
MFQWSKKKVVKSVTFEPEIADESLLVQVEGYLEAKPEKTFSDLCKEALWQALCVPESGQRDLKAVDMTTVEQQINDLKRQVAGFEERFFAKESNRLQLMESQMLQLSQQVAQLALILGERQFSQTPISSVATAEVVGNSTYSPEPPLEEVDPVISRLSQFLDDF